MLRLGMLAALAAMSVVGAAGAAGLSKTYDQCVAHSQADPDYAQCGNAEINRQDARLNTAWAHVTKCLAPDPKDASMKEARQNLLDEQRLWLKWKESSCEFYDARGADGLPVFGSEGQTLKYPACRAGVIAQRAEFLEAIAKDVCD